MSRNDRLAVWLQGAMTMIGDRLPTELEWQLLKDKIDQVVAQQVVDKLASNTPWAPSHDWQAGDLVTTTTSPFIKF
jgi:hypothetical protein